MKVKKFFSTLGIVFLVIAMLFSAACSTAGNIVTPSEPDNKKTENPVTDPGNTDTSPDNGTNVPTIGTGNTGDEIVPTVPGGDSEDLDKLTTETFLYNVVYANLSINFDTFIGYITPEDAVDEEDDSYGICFVDYEEGYVDGNDKTYFSAGFISLPGYETITHTDIPHGLEIISIEENSDERFSYVYAYETEEYHSHYIFNDLYVSYDIVDGVLTYEEKPYVYGMNVDSTRGNIYNYDTNEFVYIVEEIDYVPTSGTSLIGSDGYQNILDEANKIIQTQDLNLSYRTLETYCVKAMDALYSFILNYQEETFLGIETDVLADMVSRLDPMEHIRITVNAEGATCIEIIEITKLATIQEKVITSIVCSYYIISAFVLQFAGVPTNICGSMMGAWMEIFYQVVIDSTPVSDIEWEKVAIAAVSGFISGTISSFLSNAISNVLLREVVDTLCDGIIGGTEFFAYAVIDGKNFEEACEDFGYGFVTAVIMSAFVKGISYTVKGIKNAVSKSKTPKNTLGNTIGDESVEKLSKETLEDGSNELLEKSSAKTGADIASDAVNKGKSYVDDFGNVFRQGDELVPNSKSTINGYDFKTDDIGRTSNANGYLYLKDGSRLTINDSMDIIAKGDQLATDHRFHLIGDRFGGYNGLGNLVAGDGKLNLTAYKQMENAWADALREGKKVFVNIDVIYEGLSNRPSKFNVKYIIDGIEHFASFAN